MDYRQQEVISRAKSLRQRFADSRSGTSSSISTSPLITTRWQSHHHHQFLQEGSPTAGSDALATASLKPQFSDVPTPAGSKSPSPSRTSIKSNEKRPSSVSWMVTNPRGHCSRPGTPTAGYPLDSCAISSAVAAAASLVAVTASSGAQQVRQMSDDFAADLVVEPSYLYSSSKVNLNRRGVLTSFKSKSLDLLGTSRILPPHQLHHHHDRHRTDENSPGRDAAAERRRRLFRRKKANSASCSYDESPSGSQQSRSSSVESNQSAQHAIQRGLEAALKTSTLFAWSSVEASSANQHLLQQTNQPSFVEHGPATTTMDRRLSPSAKSSSPILSRPENSGPSGCPRSASTSPNSNRRTNVTTTTTPSSLPPASISGLTLSPLLGSTLMGGPRVTARRSWSPQHQSSLEVPTPRQIQSARNSLAATGCSVNQQNSIESPAASSSSSISRLSRLCRRSPVRTLQPAGGSGLAGAGCPSSSGRSSISQDWISFPTRQMSEYPSDFGSFVGESFLVVDGIENSRHLQQHHHYHHHQQHHSAQGSLLLQHHLRSESISPEPASLRLVEPSSSGLAYLERVLEDQLKSGPEMTRIEHLSDLHYPDADPPCHFCSNQSSLSIHDSNRLKIVSGGRVRGRDGSRESINPPYINLPSPNVQDDEHELFPGQSLSGNCHHQPPDGSGSMAGSIGSGCRRSMTTTAADDEETEPPASVLTRRRALVPPKIPPYNMDSSEDTEQSADKETSTSCTENDGNCSGSVGGGSCGSGSSGNSRTQQRRSSFVVIPPMQICPGDLLVYSKVLTQRNSVLDWEGSTQSLAGDTDAASNAARKQKNSWSLLKLFDRSGRTKSESLSGLEEVLTCMQPSNFFDDQLSRYRGLCWMEFLANVQQQRSFSKATKSTLTSTTEEAATSPVTGRAPIIQFPSATPTIQPTRNVLVRQATHQDYSSRIKEWTQEKKARFGLVRTMSERCLDRKSVIQEVLPVEEISQAAEESDVDIPAAANIGEITFPPFEQPQPQQPTPCPPTSGPKCELRGREALWDLFQSECAFLYDHIMVLKNVYMDPLKKIQVEGYAMFAEPELLFGNLDELCCVTYSFCKEFISLLLHHAQAGGGDTKTTHILTKLFQKSSKAHVLSQAYHRYALNYINALNYLETLRRHMEFCEFEKWCNRDPRCKKLQLTDLLVAPVQHIMKVPLLLREIESRTEDVIEKEAVLKILDKEEASLRELDDKMKWLKNFERLLEIQRSLVWPSVLDIEPKVVVPEFLKAPLAKQPCERLIVSPRRQIVLEGPLSLLDTGRPIDMHVILFDDMLLITRKKKGLGKKKSSLSENWTAPCSSRSCLPTDTAGCWRYIVYKQPLSLDRFFLHEINVHEAAAAKLDNGFVIISLNRFQQIIGVHTFQASSDQVKQTWLLKIRETQDHWKRTLQTTVFRAQGRTLSQSPSTIPTHAAVSPNAAAPAKS
ncbi:uncharacterized protein LOC124331523 isoform X1 [Daphnia pulicaria]|uniref:uncharacterized protein LOC124331523 isoform X1 n=1 Tax=Daphnia pulicaria TaxID=35523 RepID=UPI001EEC73AB|nr:uncharacterized protein LOC124331523 isoform X1 [Daphnia pulicaria]XP_046644766.1 uncharacterized protein LOC124331523 isoform X1 [Daphnia pulicaria]XP_046644767.1 uncharacterized protein LOC124331523 isoform X1 [Daphnia pulicaria]